MELESLSQLLVREKEEDRSFQRVDYHFVEIATLLFTHAKEDIPNHEQVYIEQSCFRGDLTSRGRSSFFSSSLHFFLGLKTRGVRKRTTTTTTI